MTHPPTSLTAALAGRYAFERVLGRGGMATVYLARELRHDRPVAFKVLDPHLARVVGPERFHREVLLTARLQHPHILPVLDSGESDGALWYTMPFVEGETLRQRLSRERQLPLQEAARLTREIAAALDEAHRRGVVHRDIKPENILLTRAGDALVADFGIAKLFLRAPGETPWETLTETGLVIGTPEYMPPEQATGSGPVDARTDVYALGCLAYEMLAGEPPFTGTTAQSILAKRLTNPPPSVRTLRDTVPLEWDAALRRALALAPADRFGTAGELAAALSPGRAVESTARTPRTTVAAVIGLLAVATVGVWLFRRPAAPPPLNPRIVAILPFQTGSPDTALQRLGRDLVFTLSATLDGVGDVHTADAHSVLALADFGAAVSDVARSRQLAGRLGAGRLIEGSLVRQGDRVRIDAVLYATREGTRITRAGVAYPADSIARITDSLTFQLLPSLLSGTEFTSTTLEMAFRTRSLPAVRSFLDGEQKISQDRWDEANAAFGQAFATDSTFWLSAARLAFSKEWALEEVPATLEAGLRRHLDELPPRERLEVEARQALGDSGVSASLAVNRALITRFPENWLGWLSYGDLLLHSGPSVGESLEGARNAFQRVMDLNPGLAPGWDHDALLAALAGDSLRLRTGLAALERKQPRPSDPWADKVLAFRLLDALVRRDSVAAASALDSVARDKVAHARHVQTYYEPVLFGFPAAQIRLSRAVLAYGGGALGERELRLQIAQAFAAAGAWDSALALAPTALDRYRLAVLGAAVGEVPWERALALQVRTGAEPERLFLDGVAAAATGDRQAAVLAARRLAAVGSPTSRIGVEALHWFTQAAAGDSLSAGRGLAALEWRLAERRYEGVEALPSLPPLDRIFAARWLAAAGDRREAGRLLRWVESPFLIAPGNDDMPMLTPYFRRQQKAPGNP